MPAMPEENQDVQEEKTSEVPPVDALDPYSALGEDEPHPASDSETSEEGSVEAVPEGDGKTEEEAVPAPTIESLQSELAVAKKETEKQRKSQQSFYEQVKQLKRRNVLEDRMDALEADVAEIDEAEEFETEEPPDPVIDPTGAAAFQAKRAVEAAERVERKLDERTVEEKRATVLNEIKIFSAQQHETFVVAHPDYAQAAAVVQEATLRNFRALGIPEEERPNRLAALMDNFVLRAFQERNASDARSASQMMYDAAKEFGYVPPNGQPGEGTKEKTPAPGVPSKIQKAAARVSETTTLAATPGSAGSQQNISSIKKILKAAELDDPDGMKYQTARDYVVANVKAQLPRGASDDDAEEAIATELITQVK